MHSTTPHSHAETLPSRQQEEVRAELDAILKSHFFASSKRCQDLLEFVVTEALEGHYDNLTERFIGARVFGRPIEYETATDAIVRVRANDVRRRLGQYDATQPHPAVRIHLAAGSYVPEFRFASGQEDAAALDAGAAPGLSSPSAEGEEQQDRPSIKKFFRRKWLAGAVILAVLTAGALWLPRFVERRDPVSRFWAPILKGQGDILLCAGGNTFKQGPVPGFVTAGKEIDYPYFSLQTEVSTTLLSMLIERNGGTPQFRFAATTQLPEFHEHPIILLNAYNNQWTLRLTEPLRFHFSPESHSTSVVLNVPHEQFILDRQNSAVAWYRDSSQPYENTPDYALVARFWDKTTDNWVVVLAGLGRNGTEAAARFVVDPHYMQELRGRLGSDFANRNIEVVLRVPVVDGRTGSPEIMAVHAW